LSADVPVSRLLLVSLLLLMVATCGQKGPLRMPDPAQPKPSSVLS
jgi:predicted small lipoprotein YifL